MYFPCELLYDIVKYTALGEVVKVCISLCPGISEKELNSIILSRKSIDYLFSDICLDVPELLDVMTRSGTVLSGAYARNYFNSANISSKDVYKFYCHNHPLSCMRFIEYLKYSGINWVASAYILKDGPPSQHMFRLQGYHELSDGRRNYILVYWPMISNADIEPMSMLRLINKGQSSQIYTIWGSMAMSSIQQNSYGPSKYIPIPNKSYLVRFNTRTVCQTISTLPATATLYIQDSKISQLNSYEHALYETIISMSRVQVINIVTAILPYTLKYMPKYMSIEAWREILSAIIYRHKLTLYT